jgi:hypothetical protein
MPLCKPLKKRLRVFSDSVLRDICCRGSVHAMYPARAFGEGDARRLQQLTVRLTRGRLLGLVLLVGLGKLLSIEVNRSLQSFQELRGNFGLLKNLESDCTRNRMAWRKASIQDIEIAGDAVMEPMNPVTQIERINLAASPSSEL